MGLPSHFPLRQRSRVRVHGLPKNISRMLGAVERSTSSAHAQANGMVEWLNHKLCEMLSQFIADNQINYEELLLYAIIAHNNSVSRGTGLAANEAHIVRYPRLPITILEGRGARNHQGHRRDQLDLLQLMRERQNKAYELVRNEDFLIKAKHHAANEKLKLDIPTTAQLRSWTKGMGPRRQDDD